MRGARGQTSDGARRWLRGQLRNIAPFITLLLLVIFFAWPALLRHARQSRQHPDPDLDHRNHGGGPDLRHPLRRDRSQRRQCRQRHRHHRRLLHRCRTPASTSPTCRCRDIAAILLALSELPGLLGLITAFGITWIGIPSFIMTLAMLQIGAGICGMLVRGQIAYEVPPLVATLGSDSLGPVPWLVIVAAIVLGSAMSCSPIRASAATSTWSAAIARRRSIPASMCASSSPR